MSGGDSTGFDEWTESTALLGQHRRISDPTAADATAALAYKSGYISQRLEVVLSQCQTDGEIDREMWDDFEIHRRSADTYMNQYLDCLQQVQEQRSGHVREIDDLDDGVPPTGKRAPDSSVVTRKEWRLKISRDALARDLLAMHETLEFLKMRTAPPPRKGALSISALTISAATLGCILWRNSHRKEAIGVLAADVAGVACYYSSEMWKWLRTRSIEHVQENVEALFRRLNRGEVDEQNRGLHGMSPWMVDQFRK
ncbi:hypothetical protein AYL99_11535 [Fonsecaea erecta]|uniref:Uncharacterized protein n=1 Tax=Fonsecaea erecta TaxID=1367422 RepID=A0A178Z3W9_9EURO|nr:hypothetical protein AYL99_11535 [Fonsecaea erecta]OAP54434.1 hypothetical protein AYL99_11535 [Fonsecaea erecta]